MVNSKKNSECYCFESFLFITSLANIKNMFWSDGTRNSPAQFISRKTKTWMMENSFRKDSRSPMSSMRVSSKAHVYFLGLKSRTNLIFTTRSDLFLFCHGRILNGMSSLHFYLLFGQGVAVTSSAPRQLLSVNDGNPISLYLIECSYHLKVSILT